MVGRELIFGHTARTVAANVRRRREDLNLTYTQLAERMRRFDSTITAVGVRRVEAEQRRVTADDLVSLALALDVSPVTLMMPFAGSAAEPIDVTGVAEPIRADRAWRWLTAGRPLQDGARKSVMKFVASAVPEWALDDVSDADSPAMDSTPASNRNPHVGAPGQDR